MTVATPRGHSRRRACVVGAAATVVLAATACSPAVPSSTASSTTTTHTLIPVGAQVFASSSRLAMPAIAGTSLAGDPVSLRGLDAHGPLVVNVWASWCESCRTESAALARASRHSPGVTFVGLDEMDDPGHARAYAARAGITYPQLPDPDGTILAQLSVLPSRGIPSTLIVDRRFRMAARIIGPVTGSQLRTLLAEVDSKP